MVLRYAKAEGSLRFCVATSQYYVDTLETR